MIPLIHLQRQADGPIMRGATQRSQFKEDNQASSCYISKLYGKFTYCGIRQTVPWVCHAGAQQRSAFDGTHKLRFLQRCITFTVKCVYVRAL